jgi:hypothetical protein
MGSILARVLLFLSSYFPLAAIFYILFVAKRPWVAAGILFFGLLGLLGTARVLTRRSKTGADSNKGKGHSTKGRGSDELYCYLHHSFSRCTL